MMPLEKKQYLFALRLSEPKLELINASNQIGFYTHIDLIAPGGLKFGGRGQVLGALRYEAGRGELYIDAPKLKGLEIDWLPKRLASLVANLAEPLLATASKKYPIYRLRDDSATHQLAKSTLKSIRIVDHKLVLTLGIFKILHI